jgi:hypothetical protein
MSVFMDLWLVGNPEHYLAEDEPVTPSELRDLGRRLRDYADEAADLVGRLTAAGWTARADGRHVNLFHPTFETEREVEDHLRSLGIASLQLSINEYDPDDALDSEEVEERWEERAR